MQIQTSITLTKQQRQQIMLEEIQELLKGTIPVQNNSEFPQILSMYEAAELLDVHYTTVSRWTIEGRLPHKKIGKVYNFRKSDILEFKEARKKLAPTVKKFNKLGKQWLLCEAVNFFPPNEKKNQPTIEFIFATNWLQESTIIKKTVPQDHGFIIDDFLRNVGITDHGNYGFYEAYLRLKARVEGKQVFVEVVKSNNKKFPYNVMTPESFKEWES